MAVAVAQAVKQVPFLKNLVQETYYLAELFRFPLLSKFQNGLYFIDFDPEGVEIFNFENLHFPYKINESRFQ